MDQIKDGVPLTDVLETISNYNIDSKVHGAESRNWAQLFLTQDQYPPYQIQHFQSELRRDRMKTSLSKTKKKQNKKRM